MRKSEYNLCSRCGSKPIRDVRLAINTCPNCGFKWTDTYAEDYLKEFWDKPERVRFD